jgi:hypothetical protein
MKKTVRLALPLIILIVIGNTVTAQFGTIPSTVTESFKEKYPTASNVEWQSKLSSYSVVFLLDSNKHEARFNKKGAWQETECELSIEELPEAVKDGFDKSKFATDWEMEAIHKIELPGDKIQYRIEVAKSDLQKRNLLFNAEGRLLKDKVTF